ncbi:cilia- and flagella-associated protein 97-like [Saccostrea cucullata]|uniref:cilia- and flagella-associated protein 97-like n=1 Tax=Saccostrea cuccullata TaxID=36930 RepID=UPI002ED5E8DC
MASVIKTSAGERVDFDFFDTPRNKLDDSLESLNEDNRIFEVPPDEKGNEKHGDVSFRAKEKKYSSSESSGSEVDSDIESESDISYSSGGSTSRVQIKNKGKKSIRKADSDSYSSDSSAYSDESSGEESRIIEEERKKAQKKGSRYNRPDDKSKEAWGHGIERINITKKTPSSEDLSNQRKDKRSASGKSGSDSEMTDVSPLPSPRDLDNGHVQYSNQVNHDSGEVQLQSKQLDLSILMEAVSEIDKQQRIKSNRRVMFEPPKPQSSEKSNFTFDTQRVKFIEKENQRLLKEIMRHIGPNQGKKKGPRDPTLSVQRVTPSAINRQREQRRIEMENMQFLQRLQHTGPTKGLSRKQQLKDYKHTLLHGVPIAAMHSSPVSNHTYVGGNTTLGSTMGSTGQRSRPSSAKSNASTIRSRPGSAKSVASSIVSRPCSAKSTSRSIHNRPAWNDRFAYS